MAIDLLAGYSMANVHIMKMQFSQTGNMMNHLRSALPDSNRPQFILEALSSPCPAKMWPSAVEAQLIDENG